MEPTALKFLRYVLIPSEPEHFCLVKLIPEALPLLEATPVVRSVRLYKLLCGVSFGRSSFSNALPLTVSLRQEKGKTRTEHCEGRFVADAPVDYDVCPTSAAQVHQANGCVVN